MSNRDIKFRAWYDNGKDKGMFFVGDAYGTTHPLDCCRYAQDGQPVTLMQYTGLKDANGIGLTELYEGDILSENGVIVGSIYEVQQRETDLVIPCIRSKDWLSAYQEAVARGFDYAK